MGRSRRLWPRAAIGVVCMVDLGCQDRVVRCFTKETRDQHPVSEARLGPEKSKLDSIRSRQFVAAGSANSSTADGRRAIEAYLICLRKDNRSSLESRYSWCFSRCRSKLQGTLKLSDKLDMRLASTCTGNFPFP